MALFALAIIVTGFLMVKYDRIITERLSGQLFNSSAKIFARPKTLHPGDAMSASQIASQLHLAGYVDESTGADSTIGTYAVQGESIVIHPGPGAFQNTGQTTISTSNGRIQHISNGGNAVDSYQMEPQLLTALGEGEQRTKRQLLSFNEIPPVMVNAVTSVEDRHFFQHSGVNFFRLFEAIAIDLTHRHNRQGGSTLTMQLARGFFLTPERTIKRKAIEILISIELEHKLNKQQIFETYANYVPMGQRGSFSINGLGEAEHTYFGKDIKNVTLAEAATLAGIIQRPSYFNPYHHPDRVIERRNVVLDTMVESGAISQDEAAQAKAEPLKLAPPNIDSSDAPYFVDLVKDTLSNRYKENDLNSSGARIYTTIDADLQKAAAEAVDSTIKMIDTQSQAKNGHKGAANQPVNPGHIPQVALVAIDPHTGDVLAMIGGRNYGFSQLNHALASRPTGSIFKPFVYATAINTGLDATAEKPLTAVTMLNDEQTTFEYDGKEYAPHNFASEYRGTVPAFFALQMSLNNATVQLGQMVGFDKVAALGRAAGVSSAQGTPSVALGAYSATPLEMAGAYTVFANNGNHMDPILLRSLRSAQGEVIEDFHTNSRQVLDPRVAYVMTTMLENVVNHGTGAGVRARGFSAPAAGKTGTSHDAWFAGYTTNLLCVVWVGYDDYSNLNLQGATTAAPVWGEFMKRAVALPQYKNAGGFAQPTGVVDVPVDRATGLLTATSCPSGYTIGFLDGTEPSTDCEQHPVDTKSLEHSDPETAEPDQQLPPSPTPKQQTHLTPQPALPMDDKLLALVLSFKRAA